jgi:hypothetical protein
MKNRVAALLLASCGGLAQAGILVASPFDNDHEGWTALNGINARGWVAQGGQQGGYIQARDDGEGTVWIFEASSAYLGDKTAALGGSLSFWLRTSTLVAPMVANLADVRIGGGGLILALDAGPSPGLDWTYYSLDLTPGAWRLDSVDGPLATAADFATVFANIEHIQIRGEYSASLDIGGLDSVMLSAVPELPTAWLAALGIAALTAGRRR